MALAPMPRPPSDNFPLTRSSLPFLWRQMEGGGGGGGGVMTEIAGQVEEGGGGGGVVRQSRGRARQRTSSFSRDVHYLLSGGRIKGED